MCAASNEADVSGSAFNTASIRLNISGGRPARSTAARTCSTLIFLMAGSIDRAQDTTHNSLVIADRKSDPSLRPAHRDNSVRSRFSCSDRLLTTASNQTPRIRPPAPRTRTPNPAPAPRTCTSNLHPHSPLKPGQVHPTARSPSFCGPEINSFDCVHQFERNLTQPVLKKPAPRTRHRTPHPATAPTAPPAPPSGTRTPPAETWPGSPHSKKSKLLRSRNQSI